MRTILLAFALLAGCGYEGVFVCDSDTQCRHEDVTGKCEKPGDTVKYCVFPDLACASGTRWDEHAGDGYGKLCVGETPPSVVDASTGSGG